MTTFCRSREPGGRGPARLRGLVALAATLALAACGGGGGSGASTPTTVGTLASLCSPLSWFTQGGSWEVVASATSGATTTSADIAEQVVGPTTFQGNPAYEVDAHITITQDDATPGASSTLTSTILGKNYAYPTGPGSLTMYGNVTTGTSTLTAGGSTTSSTTATSAVYTPAFVDNSYGLTPGASLAQTFAQQVSTTTTLNGGAPTTQTSTTNTQQTVHFVDIEQVTVPAGTYYACRIDTTTNASGQASVSSQYLLVGYGIPIMTKTDGVVGSMATSVKVNGQPL